MNQLQTPIKKTKKGICGRCGEIAEKEDSLCSRCQRGIDFITRQERQLKITILTEHPKYGICLDAGSGIGPKRPAQGFSAYCDIIIPKNGDIVPENYHVAPLENMSCFQDKQFDYVRCHHALEHCIDPDKACAELIRVGKSGLISYPPMQSCILFGRADHKWFMTVDRGRLIFIRKRHESYGIPRKQVGTELNHNFAWKDSFKWLTVR